MANLIGRIKSFPLEKKIVLGGATVIIGSLFVTAAASPHTNQKAENSKKPQHEVLEKQTPETKKLAIETTDIPFEKTTVNDPNLEKGSTALRTAGINGKKTLKYEMTFKGGRQVNKELVSEEITEQPVTEVLAIGTYSPPVIQQSSSCHPSYSGACVPKASDVDCAGGSGNGPAYVSGPVTIVGPDAYGLDRDGDGVGCE